MKLYDMESQEWREGNFERGDSWRSNIAYRCEICHVKTNEWVMGGWPGTGPRILCPGDLYEEHDKLESALERYQSLDTQIEDFEKTLKESSKVNKKRAQNMINNLCAQKELLGANVGKLRRLFAGRLDDLKGLDANSKVEDFYPSSRYADEKKSLKTQEIIK